MASRYPKGLGAAILLEAHYLAVKRYQSYLAYY